MRRLVVLWLGVCLLPFAAGAANAGPQTSAARKPTATAPKKANAPVRRGTARTRARARRAAAAARDLAEARTPRYRLDENGEMVPDVRAAAAIVYDPATDKILWEEHSQDQRSIASITKVMTAVVFLESSPDLSQEVKILRADTLHASTTYLKTSDQVRVEDLLHLLLIPSDNAAARALARISPFSFDGFVDRMNQKAAELGLQHTSYTDPSGLDSNNVSSAYDMARLISYAANDSIIGAIMRTPEYSFRTMSKRPRPVTVRSTNQILRAGDLDVQGGKTGFISKAGYCLATLLKLPEGGPSLAVVVLGATSSISRFWDARNLLSWFSGQAQVLSLSTPTSFSSLPPQ